MEKRNCEKKPREYSEKSFQSLDISFMDNDAGETSQFEHADEFRQVIPLTEAIEP